jgi:hypothetical protein
MVKLLFSHPWTDQTAASRLVEGVRSLSVEIVLDGWRLRSGGRSFQSVERAPAENDLVAVLLTEVGVLSGWVEEEWWPQIGQAALEQGNPVLLVRGDETPVPEELAADGVLEVAAGDRGGVAELRRVVKRLSAAVVRRRLPQDLARIPLVQALTGELGVPPEALERLLVALPTPESFLGELRGHVGDRAEVLERLFYDVCDGVGDLWRAGQLAKLIAEG